MIVLRSFAALAVTALLLQALPSKAQDSTSSSGSTSSSSSSSGATSGSRSSTGSATSGTSGNQQRSNQRVNSTTNIPITFNGGGSGAPVDPAGPAGPAGANGGGSNTPGGPTGQPFYGQSDVTIRTTPTVYAPPVSGGNPCTLAVSGGVSVIGWGAAAGGTFVDKDCADRQKIAMIHNAGYAKAAQELMCNDRATYMAFRGTDKPCNPRPEFDGPPSMSQQPAPPMVITPQPPQQQVIMKDRSNLPRCSRTITDNCFAG